MFLNEPKLILLYTVKWFQVLLCITNNLFKLWSFVCTQLNDQTIPIWPIDRTLSGATTLGQIRSGSNGNEEVLCIPQSSSITEPSPSNGLLPYPGHSFGKSYSSAKTQLVYSTAPADWALQRIIIISYFKSCDRLKKNTFTLNMQLVKTFYKTNQMKIIEMKEFLYETFRFCFKISDCF